MIDLLAMSTQSYGIKAALSLAADACNHKVKGYVAGERV